MEIVLVSLLNGLVYGMLLFMLASGLTLIFSMMGVLNFAHASIYMIGAYLAFTVSQYVGFFPALIIAPLLCGLLGAAIEIWGLRRVHANGHIAELLFTFGLVFIIGRSVQMIWGMLPMPYRIPPFLDFPLFTFYGQYFPAYRGFMLLVLAGGCVLAGLAGVIGGNYQTTEPGMADSMGPIVFVVVVFGGLGSLMGCFVASILMGMIQSFAVVINVSLLDLIKPLGVTLSGDNLFTEFMTVPVARIGALLPFALMILMLLFRPRGLMGTRDT
jgi:branched-chain amino acid transport system permease protein